MVRMNEALNPIGQEITGVFDSVTPEQIISGGSAALESTVERPFGIDLLSTQPATSEGRPMGKPTETNTEFSGGVGDSHNDD